MRNLPRSITAFIEMVPTDTVKYELDKVSGYIKIDRPQNTLMSFRLCTVFYLRLTVADWWRNIV